MWKRYAIYLPWQSIKFHNSFFNGNRNAEYRAGFAHHPRIWVLAKRFTLCTIKRNTHIAPAVCTCVFIVKGIVASTLITLLIFTMPTESHQLLSHVKKCDLMQHTSSCRWTGQNGPFDQVYKSLTLLLLKNISKWVNIVWWYRDSHHRPLTLCYTDWSYVAAQDIPKCCRRCHGYHYYGYHSHWQQRLYHWSHQGGLFVDGWWLGVSSADVAFSACPFQELSPSHHGKSTLCRHGSTIWFGRLYVWWPSALSPSAA